jgi:hypothetical protein
MREALRILRYLSFQYGSHTTAALTSVAENRPFKEAELWKNATWYYRGQCFMIDHIMKNFAQGNIQA